MTRTGDNVAPIIVSALLGPEDFAWADALRRAHYPADRNQVPAHLTLFHHLPPSALDTVRRLLRAATLHMAAPPAQLGRPFPLGRGVAYRVECAGMEAIRERIAEAMAPMLTAQDAAASRPHITVQNKADPADAKRLLERLAGGFRPREIAIDGLAAWWYRGGPWEAIAAYRFSRSARSRRN